MNNKHNKRYRYGFILLHHFSMLPMTSAVEVMRMANQQLGYQAYEWQFISMTGQSVKASDGIQVAADLSMQESLNHFDCLFVCGGIDVEHYCPLSVLNRLRDLDQQGIALGALCTGAYVLAKAGLLDGRRCTVQWEYMDLLREEYPNANLEPSLFVLDRDRITCAGGTAPLDMMMNLINHQFSPQVSAAISEIFIADRIRTERDHQKTPIRGVSGSSYVILKDSIALMESNIEEPIPLDEIASYVQTSRRQLERLFKKYLGRTPSNHYLYLRLMKARKLLIHTTMSITEVGLACGFVTSPHFSRSYRTFFSVTPTREREMMVSPV